MLSDCLMAGPPRHIPLSIPYVGDLEKGFVQECLDSGWVSSAGAFVTRFEEAMVRETRRKHAVAVASGTAALHLALLVSGVERGDEVIVPTLTFIAPANAIRYVGARPVLVDADPTTWQLDVDLVERFLRTRCKRKDSDVIDQKTGRRVSALLPVHVLGHPVDMEPLQQLAGEFELVVIEDASEALGSTYKGDPVGSRGDVSCFSFNGNKIVTCGGGGMLLTDDPDLAERARHLSTQAKKDPVRYIHDEVGYNYRLTNVQAALGYGQIASLQERVEARRRVGARYRQAFAGVPGVSYMPEADWAVSNRWLSTIALDPEHCRMEPVRVVEEMAASGIETRPLWQPLHESIPYRDSIYVGGTGADTIHASALCLPSSFQLTEDEQGHVIGAISRLLTD